MKKAISSIIILEANEKTDFLFLSIAITPQKDIIILVNIKVRDIE